MDMVEGVDIESKGNCESLKPETATEGSESTTGSNPAVRSLRYESPAAMMVGGALLIIAVLAGIVLRWYHLGRQSLWFDEGYTAWAVGLSPSDIVRFAQNTDAPPLYFLLQHYWRNLFGNSEYALRGVSALCGTLALPVFYAFARKVLKDRMAVTLAVWLFAFSLMQLWYSQEARYYALASLLALIGLYALVLFLETRAVTLFAAIVASIVCSLYTHNMMLFYLLALDLTWLIYPSERTWTKRLREVLLANVLAGALYLPWVPSLLTQAAKVHQHFWVSKPTVSTLFHTLTNFAGLSPDYLFAVVRRLTPLPPRAIPVLVLAGMSLLCAAMVAGGLWGVSKEDKSKNVSLLVYALLPILLVFILSRISTPVFIDRVFIDSSAVIPIIFAAPLAFHTGRKGRVAYGFLAVLLGVATTLSGFGYLRHQQKEEWRSMTMMVSGITQTNRLIAFMSSRGEFLFNYYTQRLAVLGPRLPTIGVPARFDENASSGPIRTVNDIGSLKLAVESEKYSEIDLVLSRETGDDPNGLVLDYLKKALVLREKREFNGMTVFRFENTTVPR
jgi:uncharacterized membrane protein